MALTRRLAWTSLMAALVPVLRAQEPPPVQARLHVEFSSLC